MYICVKFFAPCSARGSPVFAAVRCVAFESLREGKMDGFEDGVSQAVSALDDTDFDTLSEVPAFRTRRGERSCVSATASTLCIRLENTR